MIDRVDGDDKMEKENVATEQQLVDEKLGESEKNIKKREMSSQLYESKGRNLISIELKEQMKDIKHEISEDLNNRMIDAMLNTLRKMDRATIHEMKDFIETEKYCNRRKSTNDVLPIKQFLHRNSMLTDLYEVKHIRTIYNVLVSSLILLMIHTAINDMRITGLPNLAIGTVRRGFGKFPMVFCIWSLMKGSTLCVHAAFSYWATQRVKWPPKSFARNLWDYTWVAGIVLYYTMFITLSAGAVLHQDLPVASSAIIIMEQIRMVMKIHAFVRSVAPRFLSYKPHSDTPQPKVPDFSTFVYFMFAPTLIYQDSYPRAKRIRWNIVLINFAEVLTIIFFLAIIYERILEPTYRDYGKEPIELEMLLLNVLSSILPGIILFVSGFYCLLHSWMNACAELLRFADKMFYKDWWNSNSYSTYYRTWNIVVHDWLYTYIYKDVYENLTSRNKKLAVFMVFATSAVFHEYILCLTFKFFYPVLLVLFGGVGLVMYVLNSAGNILIWFSLCLGNGMLVSFYCMEYFARVNCPPSRDDFLDFMIPRSWTCIYN
ncbi:sterol O-acyltransferase 1 [Hylaeus volcanicus]|uniref:sterol O-acyltransferase 1 n=1 Tax=Hylaeus volcanicus TaxID=313075 RepID=UPI0023B7FE3D|nr:sterol O-acyltransferase 1 [Hylaeus volcanicus]